MDRLKASTTLIVILMLTTAISCSDVSEDPSGDADPDAGPLGDVSVDDDDVTENNESAEELSYEDCIAQEDFQRPEPDLNSPMRVYDDDEFTAGANAGTSRRMSPRPPEVVFDLDRNWIHDGGYYIRDINIWSYGHPYLPRDFDLAVLHEGEHLPFNVAVVEEGEDEFVSMDEIESWSEDDYVTQSRVTLEDQSTLSYTLVIPPWAFDKKGTYPLQIIGAPVWEPAEDYWDGGWFVATSRLDLVFYVHYGSECWLPDTGDIPRPEHEEKVDYWQEWDAERYVFHYSGRFLAPPLDLYDWTGIPWEDWEQNIEFDQVFESPDPEVTLDLYLADIRKINFSAPPLAEETLYYVLRDGEVIDKFLFDGVPIVDPDSWVDEEDPGIVLPIDVELTEEVATYEVRIIPMPYEYFDEDELDGDEDDEDDPLPPMYPTFYESSQTIGLQMKYVPDED